MTQSFVSLTNTSTLILAANSERGDTTFVNYGSKDVWLGIGVDAVIGEGLQVSPNGGSLVMALASGNMSYSNISAIFDGFGTQQMAINQVDLSILDVARLREIGACYNFSPPDPIPSTDYYFDFDPDVNNIYWFHGLARNDDNSGLVIKIPGRYQTIISMQVIRPTDTYQELILAGEYTTYSPIFTGIIEEMIIPLSVVSSSFDLYKTCQAVNISELAAGDGIKLRLQGLAEDPPVIRIRNVWMIVQYIGPVTGLPA